ncbi:MAG: DIP1984 family protein [Acinetobacter sp.]|jgi:predicted  nucleic acid-binding Zn-ribbon protein|uniref:DIP1984 family protein n=1 Tax=Acinetobacter sp. TaxID=472 RepID=UPI0028224C8A|nr:DIP1984 family protein [Acinetobacter sp.]MDR2059846.1 DIP1984 family protein [Acinetobacter sp.]
MKLAEALIARADLQKKIANIRSRMEQNVKVQEGEKPAEDIADLVKAFNGMADELKTLVKKINLTNGATKLSEGSLTDAIADRDSINTKINAYRSLYNAAVIRQERFSRSEIKYVRCIDMSTLQENIDFLSKQYRELDTRIQAANWTTDLAE